MQEYSDNPSETREFRACTHRKHNLASTSPLHALKHSVTKT